MKKVLLFLFYLVSSFTVFAQKQYTQLPTFYIVTDDPNPTIGKSEYVSGTISIVSEESDECTTDVKLGIRGRGNSTWGMDKKPYRIKFDKKIKLLNLNAKAKSWVLLANYADKTLMRNAVAFEVSNYIGMEFTPSARFVDVVLNGEFLGNYMVSDQVEVGEGRVPVEEQETTDTEEPAITGGYLVELDGFASSEPVWFQTPQGLKVTVKYPKDDEINSQQRNYITDYICNFEKALFSEQFTDPANGYRAWVDETSLVNWYIACELVGNSDSFWSTYIYKKREDPHLYFGPLWDYDIAFNNDNRLGDATRKLMREAAHEPKNWIRRMWEDPWFRHAVSVRWRELLTSHIEDHLIDYVSKTAADLDQSQALNYERWNVLSQRVYLETRLFSTYSGGVDYLKTYIRERISFLTESFDNEDFKEEEIQPFETSDYYYIIMNRQTSNIIDISGESKDERAELVSWSLSNERITQEWNIRKLESGHFMLINRHSELAACGDGRNNSLIQTEPELSNQSQLWDITPVYPDVYALINVKSGLAVENYNGSTADGNKLIEATASPLNLRSQQWYLEKTETSVPDASGLFSHAVGKEVRCLTIGNGQIRFILPEGETDVHVNIHSLAGVLLRSEMLSGDTMDISTLSSGVYLAEVKMSGQIYHLKFFLLQ
ncbi:CotH kinase family protein [Bacteroides sp.]